MKILINNYYDGISPRGIIAHIKNLTALMIDEEVEVSVFRCPAWLYWFPWHGMLFHFFEQFIIPIFGLRFDRVIYPYNSASIFSIFHRGSILIVHDFIQNRSKIHGYKNISARLVRWTQWIYRKSNRDVVYITDEVSRQARLIQAFPKSREFIIPNCFYLFRQKTLLRRKPPDKDRIILLCSGRVPTKDLAGAMSLYAQSSNARNYKLWILGLGGEMCTVANIAASLGIPKDDYKVLPYVSDDHLIDLYFKASLVWVHSLLEGFGRNIAEALICDRHVIASRIIPFVRQARKTSGIYLYSNRSLNEFDFAVSACQDDTQVIARTNCSEDIIRQSLTSILQSLPQ